MSQFLGRKKKRNAGQVYRPALNGKTLREGERLHPMWSPFELLGTQNSSFKPNCISLARLAEVIVPKRGETTLTVRFG